MTTTRDGVVAHIEGKTGMHISMLAKHVASHATLGYELRSELSALRAELSALRTELSALRTESAARPIVYSDTSTFPWQAYVTRSDVTGEIVHGIYMDVPTTTARFTSPANVGYTASVEGDGQHWDLVGMTSIYPYMWEPTAAGGVRGCPDFSKGFRIYVRSVDNRSCLLAQAKKFGWKVKWVGIQMP